MSNPRHHPTVAAAYAVLTAALDGAKLSKSRRGLIDRALLDYCRAFEAQTIATVTPTAVTEALGATGRVVWLDGYHHALRDASRELGDVFHETVTALDAQTSELRIDCIMSSGGMAALPLWKGADDARREAHRAHHGRPLHAIVASARAASAKLLPEATVVTVELPSGPPENYADAALADAHADDPPEG